MRRKRHWGRWIVVVAVLVLVAVIGLGVWVDRSLHRAPVLADYPGRPAAGQGTTWLLVGSDSRNDLSPEQQSDLATGGDTGNGRTDTIMLIHVPGLISDVRPTLVSDSPRLAGHDPGQRQNKINAAFSLGGAALLVQTVEEVTGIRVDHYAEIGFAGFAEVVDAVGGVTDVPGRADQRSVGRHRLGGGLPETRRAQRTWIRADPSHPTRRPRPDDQPARVLVRAASPRREPGGLAEPVPVVVAEGLGHRRGDRRFRCACVGPGPVGVGAGWLAGHD